jgi:membrane protease YdiL (CAAX protease family)
LKVWLFALLLVLWGNLLHPLIGSTALLPGGSWQFVLAGAALVLISFLAARLLGLDTVALGLGGSGALRGAAIGAIAAGGIAFIAVAVLRLAPSIVGRPVDYAPLHGVSLDYLEPHIAIFLPLGAVIPEEVAFRGVLLGGLLRRYPARTAVLASAVAFSLWHVTVAVITVGNTALATTALYSPAIVGALVVLFAGGVIMGALRLVTGSLAATIAAHWVFNAVILLGLWADRGVP